MSEVFYMVKLPWLLCSTMVVVEYGRGRDVKGILTSLIDFQSMWHFPLSLSLSF